jgi:hypothetical protein
MRFERNAEASLSKVHAIFTERGGQYADTWEQAHWVKTIAVAQSMGISMTNSEARKIVAAALCDVKYWRNLGGYKEDNLLDGIAYDANLMAEMAVDEQKHHAREKA